MNLSAYLSEQGRGASKRLAEDVGVRSVMVSQWRSGAKSVAVERCVAIERATGGKVTRQELRPDDWHKFWPELVANRRRSERRSSTEQG